MINEALIWEAQRLLNQRWEHFYREWQTNARKGFENSAALALGKESGYKAACDILLAAVIGDEKKLKEFDIYGTD